MKYSKCMHLVFHVLQYYCYIISHNTIFFISVTQYTIAIHSSNSIDNTMSEDKICPQHLRDLWSNYLLPIWLFQLPVVPIPTSSAHFLLLPPRDLGTTPTSCLKVMTYECIFLGMPPCY
jgi:hypothetical protein